MKQALKNDVDMLNLINKIQQQLTLLDKKVDTLIHRSLSPINQAPKPPVNTPSLPAKTNDHRNNKGRMLHTAICADCKKECTIPFKPSGDRPVYCQDCFSRRKVINMSGIKLENKPKETAPVPTAVHVPVEIKKPQAKAKKKVVAAKKPVTKKKTAPKKK